MSAVNLSSFAVPNPEEDVWSTVDYPDLFHEDFNFPCHDDAYWPASQSSESRKSGFRQILDESPRLYAEDTEFLEYFHFVPGEQQESRESESSSESRYSESGSESTERPSDQGHRSIFVHSSPSHFDDLSKATKSAFGSIFLRTTGRASEEMSLLKTIAGSNYSMLQSLLDSFEKVLQSVPTDSERKRLLTAYKESIIRTLETQGIRRTLDDGTVHWDIYPVAQSYLFNIKINDRLHQTRNLTDIERRIISGSTLATRLSYVWPTGSLWTGTWDSLGMAGSGTYFMTHGVTYTGRMKDGMFDDDNATLVYPNKFKAINCVYEKGILKSCRFQFPDGLLHEKENWKYCQLPDRRFWSEVRKGLKPAKVAQKTEADPPRKIPPGCYDTSDGFYNPKTLELTNSAGELLRVPKCEEDLWIKKYCRKGFVEPTDFRPDLFENWYNYDQNFIQSILKEHEKYRAGKISLDELHGFYKKNGLMSYTLQEIKHKMEDEMKAMPEPTSLRQRSIKKHKGHIISDVYKEICVESKLQMDESVSIKSMHNKKSKSFIKFGRSNAAGKSMVSLPSFKRSLESLKAGTSTRSKVGFQTSDSLPSKRFLPERYLMPQPIQRPPFLTATVKRPTRPSNAQCPGGARDSSAPKDSVTDMLDSRQLRKFMKVIIMEAATNAILLEREKQRKRLKWATRVLVKEKPKKEKTAHEKCISVLENLFEVIPDKDEFCDSYPDQLMDMKLLAEDRMNMLKYWGKRIFTLKYDEA